VVFFPSELETKEEASALAEQIKYLISTISFFFFKEVEEGIDDRNISRCHLGLGMIDLHFVVLHYSIEAYSAIGILKTLTRMLWCACTVSSTKRQLKLIYKKKILLN